VAFLAIFLIILGFISIRWYRDIDRRISNLAIITAPRDCTLSCTNTPHMCALLNADIEFTGQ